MKSISITLTGTAPLMLHNERLANPRDPYTTALKKLTAQKKKTEDVLQQIAKLEWEAGLYVDNDRVVMPADNVLACIKEGARKRKLGKQAQAGVFAECASFEIDYDGPKDIPGLWDDGNFFDYRSVKVQQSRCMRARPRFNAWKLKVRLAFDPEVISAEDLVEAIETAGAVVGLCEKRPQFGRFSTKVEEISDLEKAA